MNGYEVCEAIKSDPQLRSTPVLLLTGTFEAFDEERAARAGADGHITKPFEAQSLVDQVNLHLTQAPALAPEPSFPSASSSSPEQTPDLRDTLGLQPLPDASPEGGESFDFFDEEITEPGAAPASAAETIGVSDDLGVESGGEDAFAFEASDQLHDESPSSSFSSPGTEIGAPVERIEPFAEAEIAPDSTVAILPEDDAFESALTEPSAAPATLGEEDLTQLGPEESFGAPAEATPLEDLSSDLPQELAPTHIIREAATPDVSPDPESEPISGGPDETLILSDLDTDPLSVPPLADSIDNDEAAPAGEFADDPLDQVEADDLAVEAVLDPAGSREWDISSSDLGDPLQGTGATPEAAEQLPPSPPPIEQPVALEEELLTEAAPEESPEPAPEPLLAPMEEAAASSSTGAVDLSPLTPGQLHDALEKIAWDAFSDVTEQIVKEALERIERVAWEVIPQMAEALIREEIRKLKGEES
jgi:CheY-like chemotaxis protein